MAAGDAVASTDILLCAIAVRGRSEVFAADPDFVRTSNSVPFRLHALRARMPVYTHRSLTRRDRGRGAHVNRLSRMTTMAPGAQPGAGAQQPTVWRNLWQEVIGENGQAPWSQPFPACCTVMAVGAAAYWLEWKRAGGDPGTPDFSFLFNNETFLTNRLTSQFVRWEKHGVRHPDRLDLPDVGFQLRSATFAAASYGVPFVKLKSPVDISKLCWWDSETAPAYAAFVEAREHRYDFNWLFEAPAVDPNHPIVRPALVGAPPRHAVVRNALLGGSPVAMCYGLYDDHPLSEPLAEPLPPPSAMHAVLIIGFDDHAGTAGNFVYLDSQGTQSPPGGFGQIPYSWVDDQNGTCGFTTFAAADGTIRVPMTLDIVRITNQSSSPVDIGVNAYDGLGSYLGAIPCVGQSCSLSPAQSVVLNPVRWNATYRLEVSVSAAGDAGNSVQVLELIVDDPNGASPCGAEIVIPSRPNGPPQGWFLGKQGRIDTSSRVSRLAP